MQTKSLTYNLQPGIIKTVKEVQKTERQGVRYESCLY